MTALAQILPSDPAAYLSVRYMASARGYAVFNGKTRTSDWFATKAQAERACNRQEKQMRRQVRACLCCRRPFISEWRGNRLCKPCREQPEGMI